MAPADNSPEGWVIEGGRLTQELADLSPEDRMSAFKELAKPITPKCCASKVPISWLDDLLLAVEFIGWMMCLFAPLVALLVLPLALWYWRPLLSLSCCLVLLSCVETVTQDLWPAGPPTANTDRFVRYLSWRLIFEDPKCYSGRNFIFPVVPHGIFPATLFATLLLLPRTPMHRIIGAQASSTFYFPYWRQFSRWTGGCTASQKDIMKQLMRGYSVTTFMDGIHGMFAGSSPDVDRLFVAQRKGLVKIALRTGVPLVPCYCFGQSKLVRTGQDPFGLMMWLSRALRVSLVLPVGRWFLPIPFRTPCTMVFGRPILVEKVADDATLDPSQVNELHALFLKETVALFERYKDVCGYDGKHIEIM